jgi:hypothetical protein
MRRAPPAYERTIAGHIVDAIEPIAMLALIGLALGAGLAAVTRVSGSLPASRLRLRSQAAKQCDHRMDRLMDLATRWLASVMGASVAARTLASNRWCCVCGEA